jgi:hypothetical protein
MTNARQILEEFIASLFVDPKKTAKCLLQDGAFEMPYLDSVSAFDGLLSITIMKISPRKRARVQEHLILDCFRKTGAMPTYHD